MTSLRARKVSIAAGARTLVAEADLDLMPGTLTGLVGPNGAGKSTFVRGLCGLAPLSGGAILAGETDIHRMPRQALAKLVAYLPQRHVLHWRLETRQVISLGRLPHTPQGQPLTLADRQAVDTAIAQADVSDLLGRAVDTLSGGERARVMLARALAVQTPVLLVDEPVAALDPFHALQIMELLCDLARSGRAVLVVLHDLSLAMRFCDRLVLMRDARILREGEPRAVLRPAGLAEAYRVDGIYGERDDQPFLVPWSRLPEGAAGRGGSPPD